MHCMFSLMKAVSLTLQDARKAVCDTSLSQVCYFINITGSDVITPWYPQEFL